VVSLPIVRYNPQKCLIASSGVEKIVKLWTPFELEGWTGSLTEEASGPDNPREVFSNEEYSSLNMNHDYSHQSTSEDPRMMAFFDFLVQQEIEGWNSETSDPTSDVSSDENESSRPDTTQTSDTESVHHVQFRGHRDSRRGDIAQRTKYRNRIAYLIATKRNRLKRLALKGANQRTSRANRLKSKFGPRNHAKRSAAAQRPSRKGPGKRIRRLSSNKHNKRPVSHEQTSDSEVPKSKKRRLQPNLTAAIYRSLRRKSKGTPSSTSNTSTRVEESSSDDCEDEVEIKRPKLVNQEANTTSILDEPSTSTGITASSSRSIVLPHDDFDTDDEPISTQRRSPENMARVIRSPLVEYFETPTTSHSVQKKNNNLDENESSSSYNQIDHNYSSRPNSRLSSSYREDDDCTSSSDGCFPPHFFKPTVISRSSATKNGDNADAISRELNMTPDSGIVTNSSASNSTSSTSSVLNGTGDNGPGPSTSSMSVFHQKLMRVRKNYRKNFCEDSDSE
jgi:WD repeat-containing protein 22